MRAKAVNDHRAKRRQARQARRLQRKCRVREGENLELLEELYPADKYLEPLEDPADTAPTIRALDCRPPVREFFRDLQHRRLKLPAAELTAKPVLQRVGGAPCHVVRR